MFSYWRKIDELHHINRILLATCVCFLIIILSLIVTVAKAPKRVQFWLAPSISAQGGTLKQEQIPNEYVQGFVVTLLPTILSWSQNGKDEFVSNIHSFHYYFTPRQLSLFKQMQEQFEQAQFFNRTQIASLYRYPEPQDIKLIGSNIWQVKLTLRITQRLNSQSTMVIADKVVEHNILVVKAPLSPLQNPFQLALDGNFSPEKIITDLLLEPLEANNEAP